MAMELTSYKLDLVGVQEVQKGHYKSRRLHFLSGKGNENHQLGTGFVLHHRIVSAAKGVVC